MIWKDMVEKYPMCRENMSPEIEREYVKDCFEIYESEGFGKKFWSGGGDLQKYDGQTYKVLRRAGEYPEDKDGADLECLPMWIIQFDDGYKLAAYPDEIIPSEMKDSGCPKEYLS